MFISDNEKYPCGSRKQYEDCCKQYIDSLYDDYNEAMVYKSISLNLLY
ncbi:MAG: hypothetical protein IJE43_03270 [Alphaproteobacteria bacterium]|nr:hypothetical protein [Alphaproteobacteria bacterium]MBQ6995464.1 hypothetical protein [Lachnospiraceae bacterium]